MREYTFKLARALKVVGLMNVQFAIPRSEYGTTGVSPVRAGEGTRPYASSGDEHVGTGALARSAERSSAQLNPTNGSGGKVYVLEVNPRASRTVPYVSKATGIPMAKIASRLMTGRKLREFLPEYIDQQKDLDTGSYYYVKSPVFPWNKFPGVDTVLGPEMKSTGEVMGVADNFGEAFAKAQIAAGQKLPTQGCVFVSVTDHDKPHVGEVARKFVDMGFKLVATAGTADVIEDAGMACERVYKVKEGRPNVVDLIKGDRIQLIVNTPEGADPFFDEKAIRRAAVTARIPTITTLAAARAAAEGIAALQRGEVNVRALQQLHAERLAKL
jgi:carbamoyl-phosphate synthase large subunit